MLGNEKRDVQLYYTPTSAPCRSVLMVAAALKLKLNLKKIDISQGEHLHPGYLKINPHHQVPTLIDNEFILSESRAICIYLVEKYGKNDSLYPKNAKIRAHINQLIYFDLGSLFQRTYDYFYIPVFRGGEYDESKREKLAEAFGFLEIFLADKKFAVSYRLTIADLILLSSVSTADVLGFDLAPYENVRNWYENMKHCAPGYDSNEEGLEILKTYIK